MNAIQLNSIQTKPRPTFSSRKQPLQQRIVAPTSVRFQGDLSFLQEFAIRMGGGTLGLLACIPIAWVIGWGIKKVDAIFPGFEKWVPTAPEPDEKP